MNILKSIKQLLINNFYIVLVVALMAGCASVTDATPDLQQGEQTVSTQGSDSDPIWFPTNRDQMDPIIDRPDDPQGN